MARDAEDLRKPAARNWNRNKKRSLSRNGDRAQRDLAQGNLAQRASAIAELLEVSQQGIPNEPHLEGLRERILVFAAGPGPAPSRPAEHRSRSALASRPDDAAGRRY